MQKATKVLIILFLIFVISIFYISLNRDTSYNTSSLINKELPKFEISFFNEKKFYKNNDLKKNNYTLINFWASWCLPCRKEHPILMSLNKNNKLTIIGMNYKDNKKNPKSFLDELGNPYEKIIVDKNGTNSIEWGAFGVPETFIIYNNKIIKKYIGPLNQELLMEIQKIIR